MKLFFKIVVCLALAAALGIGSAQWAIENVKTGQVLAGPWQVNLAPDGAQAGLYAKAHTARAGFLAMNPKEAVYYSASVDSQGRPLSSAYCYRVQGSPPPARWWSLTLYGADHFLIPNSHKRYSYNGNTVSAAGQGDFEIKLSVAKQPGDWLPLGQESRLSLLLRLYQPGPKVYGQPGSIALPRIIREGCP